MKRLFFSLISISLVAASMGACSSSSSGPSAAGDSGTGAVDNCAAYAAATNAYNVKCTGGVDTAHVSANNARFTTFCDALEKLDGISPTFDSAIAACAAKINAADCNTGIDQIPECGSGIPNGTLDVGAPCASGLQCASGGCSAGLQGDDGGSSTCGTCQAPVADGADCSAAPCVAGDACTLGFDGQNLTETCTKVNPPAADGASCTADSDCSGPDHCNYATADATTGTCAAPAAAGGSCSANQNCAASLVCTGGDTQVCTAAVAVGGACTASTDCVVGAGCDSTSKCAALTYAAPGGACDGNTGLCSQGTCNVPSSGGGDAGPATGTCPKIIPDGQACDDSDASQTCDDYAGCLNGVCVLVPATCN